MESVLALILDGFASMVDISQKLTFSAFGYSLSWWDFNLALMVVSVVIPLFFSLKSPSVSGLFRSGSERNDKKGGGK